jgi:hypothetical protein
MNYWRDKSQTQSSTSSVANAVSDDPTQLLRSLPRRLPPAGLTMKLRVLASREIARRKQTFPERVADWLDHVRVTANNMMRPLALPFAGGLFSAVALFSMCVVPTYPLRVATTSNFDVPTMLYTGAAIKGVVPIGVASAGDAVVDVTIDDQGRMVDYTVVSGAAILTNASMRRRLENALLFTEFVPATTFGKPMYCRVRLSLASVDVRG